MLTTVIWRVISVCLLLAASGDTRFYSYYNLNQNSAVIPAAIQSHYRFDTYPIYTEKSEPTRTPTIEINGPEIPLVIQFKSSSSAVHVHHSHTPSDVSPVQKTSSVDEPSYVVHHVLRPIIQEVREVLTPYRYVTQEIRPVVQEVNTIVNSGAIKGLKSVKPSIVNQYKSQTSLAENDARKTLHVNSGYGSAFETSGPVGQSGYHTGFSMIGKPSLGLGGSTVSDVSKQAENLIFNKLTQNYYAKPSADYKTNSVDTSDDRQPNVDNVYRDDNSVRNNGVYKIFTPIETNSLNDSNDLYQCVTY